MRWSKVLHDTQLLCLQPRSATNVVTNLEVLIQNLVLWYLGIIVFDFVGSTLCIRTIGLMNFIPTLLWRERDVAIRETGLVARVRLGNYVSL